MPPSSEYSTYKKSYPNSMLYWCQKSRTKPSLLVRSKLGDRNQESVLSKYCPDGLSVHEWVGECDFVVVRAQVLFVPPVNHSPIPPSISSANNDVRINGILVFREKGKGKSP